MSAWYLILQMLAAIKVDFKVDFNFSFKHNLDWWNKNYRNKVQNYIILEP